jgi:hypothetical protein
MVGLSVIGSVATPAVLAELIAVDRESRVALLRAGYSLEAVSIVDAGVRTPSQLDREPTIRALCYRDQDDCQEKD